jgi:DNA-binding GntR family transcriptional regulator
VPPYEVLAAEIREQIRAGKLPVGDALPSISKMKEAGHTYGTIRAAMILLKGEGLIEGRPGKDVIVKKVPPKPRS